MAKLARRFRPFNAKVGHPQLFPNFRQTSSLLSIPREDCNYDDG